MNIDGTPNIETARVAAAPRPAAQTWAAWSPALIALLLGVAALLPRVLGLADFITTDEAYHWIARTERFADAIADRRWAATIQTGHPGVTLMWLGSLGLAFERAAGPGWAGAPPLVAHLAWLRLPGALLQALLIPAGYLLLRRLLTPATALVAALLWATAPYLIAHARLLHLDALLASFVTFSVLLLLLAIEQRTQNKEQKREQNAFVLCSLFSVLGSGIFAGLALLTKGPALILLPFAGLLLFALAPTEGRPLRHGSGQATTNDRRHHTRQHATRNTQHATHITFLNSQFSILNCPAIANSRPALPGLARRRSDHHRIAMAGAVGRPGARAARVCRRDRLKRRPSKRRRAVIPRPLRRRPRRTVLSRRRPVSDDTGDNSGIASAAILLF